MFYHRKPPKYPPCEYMACACLDTSRRRCAPPKTSTRHHKTEMELKKRNIDKERAAALNRLPTRPLFLLSIKSCVVKTLVVKPFIAVLIHRLSSCV